MDTLKNFALKIKKADESEQYKYLGIFLGSVLLVLAVIIFFTNRSINSYRDLIKKTLTQRIETQQLLSDFKVVKQQQEQVNEILTRNKNFRPIQAYQEVIAKLNLEKFQAEKPVQSQGNTIDNKTELELKVSLASVNMKQLTDLLYSLSQVEQMYPKILTVKKNPNTQTVDVDLIMATLEPAVE